jgi:hypothetical protein
MMTWPRLPLIPLSGLAGVTAATVDVVTKRVVVAFDNATVTPAAMLQAIDDMGFRGLVMPAPSPPASRRPVSPGH